MPASGQSLWLYLLTGPFTRGIPGVVRAGRMAMAETLNWSQDDFDRCFDEIAAQKMSNFDWDMQLIWLPHGIEYNSPPNPNVVRSWRNEWELIPDCALKERIFHALKDHIDKLGTPFTQAFEATISSPTPSGTPFGTPSRRASRMASSTPSHTPSIKPSLTPSRTPSGIQRTESSKPNPKVKTVPPTVVGGKRARARSAPKSGNDAANEVENDTAETLEPLPDKADSDDTASVKASGKASATASRKASGKALPDTAATWAAYSEAYAARYGVEPIRNATVNSQMANFVKRVGMVEAPAIARFYVSHSNRFYVQHMHFVGSMLADAEKLRTEWVTQRQMTSTEAAQADRTAANFNAMAPLFAEARAQEQASQPEGVNHAKHRVA
ncbi:hypothetical protein [Paraburkholderia hospita]|uniref:hypothetical protein n=1 Tax=Paraburkholderia hospita TaxID=169430 RepID=UPI0012601084|nr:hypothetical protein [Paraburkholderia hospita]